MHKISGLFKKILARLQGTRKYTSKSRQSEIHNPRNEYIGFNNPAFLRDRPTIVTKLLNKLRWLKVFSFALVIAFCSIAAFDYYLSPDLFKLLSTSQFYAKMSRYLDSKEEATQKSSVPSQNRSVEQLPSDGKNIKEYKFSPEAIEKAKQNVSKEKNRQYWTPEEIDRIIKPKTNNDPADLSKYFYEIELISGGKITADDISLKDGVVEYSNNNGLVVTVKKNEIRTIKRLKATR